jgi:hypothetical protein
MGKAVMTGEYFGRVPWERAIAGGLPSRSSRAPIPSMLLSGDEKLTHGFYSFIVDRLNCLEVTTDVW